MQPRAEPSVALAVLAGVLSNFVGCLLSTAFWVGNGRSFQWPLVFVGVPVAVGAIVLLGSRDAKLKAVGILTMAVGRLLAAAIVLV